MRYSQIWIRNLKRVGKNITFFTLILYIGTETVFDEDTKAVEDAPQQEDETTNELEDTSDEDEQDEGVEDETQDESEIEGDEEEADQNGIFELYI